MLLVLGKVKCCNKVGFVTGARIQDMYYHLVPLLHKRSDKIFLEVNIKDAPLIKADEIYLTFH